MDKNKVREIMSGVLYWEWNGKLSFSGLVDHAYINITNRQVKRYYLSCECAHDITIELIIRYLLDNNEHLADYMTIDI